MLSYKVVKHSKPFSDGELLKDGMVELASIMCPDLWVLFSVLLFYSYLHTWRNVWFKLSNIDMSRKYLQIHTGSGWLHFQLNTLGLKDI